MNMWTQDDCREQGCDEGTKCDGCSFSKFRWVEDYEYTLLSEKTRGYDR